MTNQHTPTPDSAEARYKAEVERVNRATDAEIDGAAMRHERSAREVIKPSDQSAVAGAIERLWGWVEMGGPRDVSQWPEIARDLRTLLGSTEGRDDG